MDQGERIDRDQNPREKSSICSIIFFLFTLPVLRKGRKNGLVESDIYQVLPKFDSEKLGNKLEYYLTKDDHKPNAGVQAQYLPYQTGNSLLKGFFKCFGTYYLMLGIIQLVMKTLSIILQPIAISRIIAYFEKGKTIITHQEVFGYAFFLIGLNIVNCIYNHNYQLLVLEYSLRVRTALCAVIYRKALMLGPGSFTKTPIGKVVTLITKDAYTIDGALQFFNDVWIGIIQVIIVTILLYRRIQLSVFVGIGFFIAMIPLQGYCGKQMSEKRVKAAKKTEKRIQLVKETIGAIKIVKMYTWEHYFEKLINMARVNEVSRLKIIYYLKAIILTVGGFTHKLALFLTIIVYTFSGHNLTAESLYFTNQCFSALRSCITTSIPMGINSTSELSAAMKRFKEFLSAPEYKPKRSYDVSVRNPRVYLNRVSVEIDGKEVLSSVSIDLEKGLLIVAGKLGSGKSSLFKAILNEYPISGGEISVSGSISYAPEEPWLFSSSIRQNILFGQPYDENRYQEVLKVCALTHDLNQFKDFDNTIVGDNGLNLSKGQQARLCLARAIYKDSDIYLLDDCLTALDAHVNKFVFNECIRGFLKDKIVILVSNNTSINRMLPDGNVLFLEKGKTLDLKQQNEALDKRITYYIDEDASTPFQSSYIDENDQENAEESEQLLQIRKSIAPVKNLYHEESKKGKVLWKNYVTYYKFTGGIIVLILTIIIFASCQTAVSYSDKLLGNWINLESSKTKLILANQTDTQKFNDLSTKSDKLINLYIIMMLTGTFLLLVRSILTFYFCTRAGRKLHQVLVKALLHAQMSFFDTHYIGNIVNRVSKDFFTIDEQVPFTIYENFRSLFLVLGIIIVIATVNKIFLIPSLILFVLLYFIQRAYISTGRSLKRLEATTRSPMIGYINASLEGLTTVRAFKQEQILKYEFAKHQDHFTSVNYMNLSTTRMFAFSLDMMSTFYSSAVILILAILDDEAPGNVGLAITQALQLTGTLQWAIRQAAEIENTMTSVERVMEYAETESEDKNGQEVDDWPGSGSIAYDNVSLTYTTTGEVALHNISFKIPGRSRIGIVGRTGAGKSSIMSTLFRLYNYEGTIIIDGVDIKTLSLDFLRSKIAIIPQDPILFLGTIRSNIDPLNLYKDSDIWDALDKVQMRSAITSLDQAITDNGQVFSSGQRQSLCLARALVSKNKIIVLDEATANMDLETDKKLQNIIQNNFQDCTILTIAHRLYSFTSADKVIVVDDGRIVEFDEPELLLLNKDSVFYKMTRDAGVIFD